MRSRALSIALVLGTLGTLSAPVGAARASAYSKVLSAYESKGVIPPCSFTTAQLQAALRGVDVYGQQYFADFTGAIESALSQRAAGTCSPHRAQGALAPLTGGGRGLTIPRDSAAVPTGAGLPAPLALLAAFAVLIAAWLGLTAVRRLRGTDVGPPGPWRHLWNEAGWRLGGAWSEFVDWLRST